MVEIDGVTIEFKVIRTAAADYQFRPQTHKNVTKHPEWVSIRRAIGLEFREWARRNDVACMGSGWSEDPLDPRRFNKRVKKIVDTSVGRKA
jgi:hypothetical protein